MSLRPRSPEPRRASPARRALGLGAAIATAACSAPAEGPSAPISSAAPPPPRATASAAPAAPIAGRARVLYEEPWFGGVALLGVDPSGTRAVVRLAGQNPERVFVDTIDLTKGVRLDRWEIGSSATRKGVGGRGFPASDALRADVLKLASLLGALGPSHMRPALPSPTFAASADRALVLFGSPASDGSTGDWLLALGAEGAAPKRIDEGLAASYSPVIGPDGKTVAFRACSTSPCDYGVYIGEVGHRPRRLMGITGSTPPFFSRDGSHVFAVGDGLNHARCLVRAHVNGRTAADPVFCMRGASDVSLSQDEEGRTAVVSGVRGPAGTQTVDFAWILLEDGTVLQNHSVERATGGGVVSTAGLLAAPVQKGGVAVLDLVAGKPPVILEGDGWYSGFETAAFVGNNLFLLRRPDGDRSYQIVSIDARRLVDGSQPDAGHPREPTQ